MNFIYLFIHYFNCRGIFNGDNSWRTNLLYPVFPMVGPRNQNSSSGGTPGQLNKTSISC